MDDKKGARGLYRYGHIDQNDDDLHKDNCTTGVEEVTLQCPFNYLYSSSKLPSAFGAADQQYSIPYSGYYTPRHASIACQLIDASQPPIIATRSTVTQQQKSRLQKISDFAPDLKNSGFFCDSETMHQKFDDPPPQYKLKLIMWLALLFIIVGMVVVVLILTISKMQAISSVSFSFRRFEGHFLVTEGPLLKFDGRLLQKNTDEFAAHANKIQRQLDRIYRRSNYGMVYIGSEVTQFRFVSALPALDVTFILKARPSFDANALDFLSVLRSYVRARGFDGNTIDDKSISLESKRSW